MKLTQVKNVKRKAGMTLLELTVVILVLLSLISILFIGARAWKKGSDRAANILNIRNVQQAVRGHMNMNNIATPGSEANAPAGVAIPSSAIVGTNGYLKAPTGPASITYDYLGTAPKVGELYLIATGEGETGKSLGPNAADITDW